MTLSIGPNPKLETKAPFSSRSCLQRIHVRMKHISCTPWNGRNQLTQLSVHCVVRNAYWVWIFLQKVARKSPLKLLSGRFHNDTDTHTHAELTDQRMLFNLFPMIAIIFRTWTRINDHVWMNNQVIRNKYTSIYFEIASYIAVFWLITY